MIFLCLQPDDKLLPLGVKLLQSGFTVSSDTVHFVDLEVALRSRPTNRGRGWRFVDPIHGDVTQISPPEDGTVYPVNVRQACPNLNSFYQRIGQICLREGLVSFLPLDLGDKLGHPFPSSAEWLSDSHGFRLRKRLTHFRR